MIIKRHNQKKLNIQKNIAPSQNENEQNFDTNTQEIKKVSEAEIKEEAKDDVSDIFAGFNFDEIDFNQRAERRRGDRRRGYRRIDDRNLISRAQQEAIMIKEQASKEGFEKGIEDAQDSIEDLKESIQEFFEYKDALYEKISGDILDISIKVAEKIIKKEVETDKSVLDSIVHDALKTLAKDENKIILKVNPTDVEYTKEIVPDILSSGQFEAKIYVTGDREVDEGSAIIETSNGIIDASIGTQLELIKEAFKQI